MTVWRMVPVEPTEAMIEAAYDLKRPENIYHAMIAAAPKPPPYEPSGEEIEAAAVELLDRLSAWVDVAVRERVPTTEETVEAVRAALIEAEKVRQTGP